MSGAGIDVYLISGFLGAGKTTFLNRVLKEAPRDLRLLVLMNEFGEESIDGELVEDPELDMLEISRGSIFCACVKGDFIKALYQIAFTIKPEVLVIEASGVANPTDIGRDLNTPLYKGSFKSLEKICLLDAANFFEQYEVFTALEKQIEAADKFIINKVDMVEGDAIPRIKEVVLGHRPDADFVEAAFANVDLATMLGDVFSPRGRVLDDSTATPHEALLTDDDLDGVVDQMLDDETGQVTPPDRLISITCRWLSGGLDAFRAVADRVPKDVVRGKGFIFENGKTYLYSHVGRTYEIQPFDGPRLVNTSVNRVVFIRSTFEEDDIKALFEEQGISLV